MEHINIFPPRSTPCNFILLLSICIVINNCKPNECCPPECVDITNAILTNRSPYCRDYVGKYCAIVTDINYDTTFKAGFTIRHVEDKCIWYTDALPNHDFNDGRTDTFPNHVRAQIYRFEIPDNPTFAPSLTPLSLDYYNAILLNGALVDLLSDGCCCDSATQPGCGEIVGCNDITNPWRKDPMSSKAGFNPDSHNAHSQADGTYHYHGNPNALYDASGVAESPVIGFAADGFPIYGPYINDGGIIRKVTSSYRLRTGNRPAGSCPEGIYDSTYIQDYVYDPATTKGDLDECNGMTRDGHYAYYLTDGYPYIIKYFKGKPNESFKKK